ncbi:GNAT family N-acetyltransferase [Methanofollis aquaemaris]|uniref:GNAT family N-acetyltransferase n=1 Tax=Methanofollis aquaemaris TaxID=126734 RepID=UPI0022403147|nr:GNAT family N-acetyltransferase [Methanofollis aquaemaris]
MSEAFETARLRLVPATAAHLAADAPTLAGLLGAAVPDDWPPETLPDALPIFFSWLKNDPESVGWNLWYVISAEGVLVGSCGFVGRPSLEGEAEIGYAVLPAYRGCGYATEAVAALVAWAFGFPEVVRVVAQAEAGNGASVRVLEKCGFVCDGVGDEEGCVRFGVGRPRRCRNMGAGDPCQPE